MSETEHLTWWIERTTVPYGFCMCGCGLATPMSTSTSRARGYSRGRPVAFVRGHGHRLKHRLEAERLDEPNPSGLCMCGCGEKTTLARQSHTALGWVKDKPIRYLPNHAGRPLTKEQETVVVTRYEHGETCAQIGAALGVGRQGIAAILERHGIIRDTSTRIFSEERRAIYRKYECDHHFFDSIDTQGKAYWLGFLAADGCNTNGALSVGLSARDRDHLDRLKVALSSTHPIADRTVRPRKGHEAHATSSLVIRSGTLIAGHAAHGIVPRKTFIVEWPAFLPTALLRHYLRGYSDGDGCFATRKGYTRKRDGIQSRDVSWTLVGNEGFCKATQTYLVETLGFQRTKLRPSPNARRQGIFQLCYAGNRQIARLAELLYRDATIYLPRKQAIIEHLL
jgi:hypothetical protein